MSWDVLRPTAPEAPEAPQEQRKRIDRRAYAGVVGVAAVGVALAVAAWLLLDGRRVEARSAAAPTPTAASAFTTTAAPVTSTPSPTPVPTATLTPTPAPTLVAWTLAGTCSFMRAEPQGLAEIVACVPNGTTVAWTGETQERHEMLWYRVRYQDMDGWMAQGILWDFAPQAFTTTARWAPMYGDEGTIVAWLPPHTPVITTGKGRERWIQVTLPNGEQGWLNADNLAAP